MTSRPSCLIGNMSNASWNVHLTSAGALQLMASEDGSGKTCPGKETKTNVVDVSENQYTVVLEGQSVIKMESCDNEDNGDTDESKEQEEDGYNDVIKAKVCDDDDENDEDDDYDEDDDDDSLQYTDTTTTTSTNINGETICNVCGKTFPDMTQMILHEHEFTCQICTRTFRNLGACKTHIRSHGKKLDTDKLYLTTHKVGRGHGKSGNSSNAVNSEKFSQNSEHCFFLCSNCGRILMKKEDFLNHMKSHVMQDNNIASYNCPVCHEYFQDGRRLESHNCSAIANAQIPVSFSRIPAEESIESPSLTTKLLDPSLNYYSYTTSDGFVTLYTCPACGAMSKEKQGFLNHTKLHLKERYTNENPHGFQCQQIPADTLKEDDCYDDFGENSMSKSTRTQSNQLRTPPACVSGKIFHKDIHGEKDIKRRRRNHVPTNVNTCDVCHKVFSRARDVRRHILKIHQRKKLHTPSCLKCSICHKDVATESDLSRHVSKVHGGMKTPHPKTNRVGAQCHICHKIISRVQDLKRHYKQVHEPSKVPRPPGICCPICQKVIAREHDLKRHIMNVHKRKDRDSSFQCDVCGQTIARFDNLMPHMKACHKDRMTKITFESI